MKHFNYSVKSTKTVRETIRKITKMATKNFLLFSIGMRHGESPSDHYNQLNRVTLSSKNETREILLALLSIMIYITRTNDRNTKMRIKFTVSENGENGVP